MTESLPGIQSVERALDILECVSAHGEPMRAKDIAQELGLHKNTAHNLVRTLFHRGYLAQLPDCRYVLGESMHALTAISNRWEILQRQALPAMQSLSAETGDCTFLGVFDSGGLRCVALTEGSGAIRVAVRQDWERQLHCTAAGKVILAWNSLAHETFFSQSDTFATQASRTITDPKALQRDLKASRERGYTLAIEESMDHVGSVGVPVLNADGALIGALAQSFPSFYLEAGVLKIQERVVRLTQAATAIAGVCRSGIRSEDA